MRIGIIGAMEEEVVAIREQLIDREDQTIANCEFSKGKINNTEVILLKSGIGKVNAALATTLIIQTYQPDYVINTGVAGGYHQELKIGDIVISTEVRHHDVDATVFGYEYGQVPRMPASYPADQQLITVAEQSAKKLTEIHTYKGLVATGDSFNNDPERIAWVRSKMDHIYASEMEAAGVAQVCYQFSVPFVIIRSISDIVGENSEIAYAEFLGKASTYSARLVLSMLEELNEYDEKNECREF